MSLSNGAFQRASLGRGLAGPTRASLMNPAAISIAKLLLVGLVHTPLSYAAPLLPRSLFTLDEDLPKSPEDPNLWIYLGTAAILVLLGGAFAGLTIALMGQDEIYLQVIATSGEGSERKNATKVLNLLNKGKHWVLVTLLLSNVITNETLPIVLDRSLGGGWPAVLGSTILIVIFGEIAPQSVCVRYGLPIGAWMAPFVLGLMWFMAPIAWPTAKLLDWLLGEDHGTVYKKAGLKTLVTLHKTLGTAPGERLNEDEVTIISAVLDLKEKPIGDIMTPMNDVFTMSADTILDEKMMDTILSQGYSRIPIYAPENQRNFIGMLLVKILITYDPEDCMRVRDFSLATLPETAPQTSCLDIVNFFQEGKSHMVLVSDFPGQDRGALGVVTLEDVIEELIGEEIIDESDVFVDVHRAIRRMAPAPRTRYTKPGQEPETPTAEDDEQQAKPEIQGRTSRKSSLTEPRETTFMMRRGSSSSNQANRPMAVRSNTVDLRQQLRHLGPSNVASRPKATKYTSVKIKPGVSTIPEGGVPANGPSDDQPPNTPLSGRLDYLSSREDSTANEAAIQNGKKDYGTTTTPTIRIEEEPQIQDEIRAKEAENPPDDMTPAEASAFANRHSSPLPPKPWKTDDEEHIQPEKLVVNPGMSRATSRSGQSDTSPSDSEGEGNRPKTRRTARSGSITQNLIDVGGMKKMVLETTSSSDNEDGHRSTNGNDTIDEEGPGDDPAPSQPQSPTMSKKKRRKRPNKKTGKTDGDERSPLLGRFT